MAKSKYSTQTHVCPRREAPAPGGQDHRQALVPSCPQEQGSSGCSSYSPPSAVRRSSALGPARSTGKRSKAATCSTLGIWGWGGALEGNRSQLPQGHCRTPRPGHHPLLLVPPQGLASHWKSADLLGARGGTEQADCRGWVVPGTSGVSGRPRSGSFGGGGSLLPLPPPAMSWRGAVYFPCHQFPES